MVAWMMLIAAAVAAAANASVPLRIMALGASVTYGEGSTGGRSYRKDVRDALVAANLTVNYVGSKHHGNFSDNAVEATPGYMIKQIAASARSSVAKFLPNLVLVEAGTNNCNDAALVPTAGAQMEAMLAEMFQLSPGVSVVMATILAEKVADQDACRVDINAQYVALAANLTAAGAKLVLVDMRGPDGPTTADLNDTRHPNDAGYRKMAVVWNQGIQLVLEKGFLVAPSALPMLPMPPDGGPQPATGNATGSGNATSAATHMAVMYNHSGGLLAYSPLLFAVLMTVLGMACSSL